MRFDAISVFPEFFDTYMNGSIMGRAQRFGRMEFFAHDLRNWTSDRHRTVDDAPFGGGQGMLMKPEPIFEAIEAVDALSAYTPHHIFFSPVGKPFEQADAERLANEHRRIVFFCARYEGIDERAYTLADEIISLGDYVLTGGELPALVVMDAITRLLPGVLGDEMSSVDESFSSGMLEYAQYTRPANFRGLAVPPVLLSGNHQKIAEWRYVNALERTQRLRPDLLDPDISGRYHG